MFTTRSIYKLSIVTLYDIIVVWMNFILFKIIDYKDKIQNPNDRSPFDIRFTLSFVLHTHVHKTKNERTSGKEVIS